MKLSQSVCQWFAAKQRRCRRQRRTALSTVDALESRVLLTFDLQFDYTYDNSQFFDSQSTRDVLEAAAAVLESRITDDLNAIVPSGSDTWVTTFNHPGTGAEVRLSNLTIPADTVIIYVGARDLGGSLALGGFAGFASLSGSAAFKSDVRSRGESGVDQVGNTDTDFAPWVGTLAIDSGANWNLSTGLPTFTQNDLYSVALHEIAHVLGYGTSESFATNRSGLAFVGTTATADFGGAVPLHVDQAHIQTATNSTLPSTSTSQEALLDPQINTGSRKLLTELDWAVLNDIGWDVSPSPSSVDYGDAPDFSDAAGNLDYNTLLSEDGPRHTIINGLYIGDVAPDGDAPALLGSVIGGASNLDENTGANDEGFSGSDFLAVVEGAMTPIDVTVTNTTGTTATLHGWVDYNADGEFEVSERASVFVPSGTINGTVTLNFLAAGDVTSPARFLSYARFRISTDSAAATPTGWASDGEVEDHTIQIYPQMTAYDSLPSFTWPAVSGAERYEVEVDNRVTGETQVLVDSHVFGPTSGTVVYRPPQAFPPGTYRWRYRVYDGLQFQSFSDYATFTVFETAGSAVISDPVADSIDSLPTIAWSPVTNATRYELWANGVARQRVIHQTNLKGTSFATQTGLEPGTYTAWVRAYSDSGNLGPWSQPFEFTVSYGTLSQQAQVTDPATGTTINTVPTIGWRPTNGTSHRVRITDVDSGAMVVDVDNVIGTHFTVERGLAPGNYRATVDVNGLTGEVPAIAFLSPTFHVEGVIDQAQLTAPFGNSENPLPIFAWTSVAGANRYELWVNDVTNGVPRIIHDSQLTATSFKAIRPLQPGNYRVWVRAFNGSTPIGTWSNQVDFRVTRATHFPKIWAPINTTRQTAPTISWSAFDGNPSYLVSVSNADFHLEYSDVKQNFVTLNSALPPGTYNISVVNFNAGSTYRFQDHSQFTIRETDGPIEVFMPSGAMANTRPTLSWTAINNATRYFVWVNDLTRNISGTILSSEVKTTSYTADEPLLPGDYRVWVRAYNGTTALGQWSQPTTFTVTESAGAPEVTAPLYQTTNTVPTITWSAVTDSAGYDVEIFDVDPATATNGPIVSASEIQKTAFRPAQALSPGNYYVRVRSVDTLGMLSNWSETSEFRIVTASTVAFTNPLPASTVSNEGVFLAWTAVEDAASYELWVNHLDSSTVKVFYEPSLTAISFTASGMVALGRYRAWVRAIDSSGNSGTWTRGLEFEVT